MKLIRTSAYASISTAVKLVTGFLTTKFVAVLIGPVGVGIIGQFSNFISIIYSFSNGAITNGIIKYTAENKEDSDKIKTIVSTSFFISISLSIITCISILIFSLEISLFLFNSKSFKVFIQYGAISVIFFSLSSLLISINNGLGNIKKLTFINISGSFLSLAATLFFVKYYGLKGAFLSLVISQILLFSTSIYFSREWIRKAYLFGEFNSNVAKKMFNYTGMSVVSALTIPVSQIVIRDLIIDRLSMNSAGIWQGMMRISDSYLMMITTSLGVYYLPKLSSIKCNKELKLEILNGFKLIIPFLFSSCLLVYYFRFQIIEILYSKSFFAMDELFLWQLVGDFLKICSWLLGYVLIAKAMTKKFIVAELGFNFIYTVSFYFLINNFGLAATSIAFSVANLALLLYLVFVLRKIIFN